MTLSSSSAITPERTQLPRLTLQIRGHDSFSAYVTSCVVSKMSHDVDVRGRGPLRALYHLSLVGAKGQGSTLTALYSALVNNPPGTLILEGIGEVMLFSHRQDLVQLGHSLHWNYQQQVVTLPSPVPGMRALPALHGVVECNAATNFDPLVAEQQALRARHGSGKSGGSDNGGSAQKKRKASENVTLSTARKAEIKEKLSGQQVAAGGGAATTTMTQSAAGATPLFLLFAPGQWAAAGMTAQQQEARLAQLYLSFLDQRFELPLLTEWAMPLYRAALSDCQIEPLGVWSYPRAFPPDQAQILALPEGAQPFIKEAYLCRPDPVKVMQAVIQLVRREREMEQEQEAERRFEVAQEQHAFREERELVSA